MEKKLVSLVDVLSFIYHFESITYHPQTFILMLENYTLRCTFDYK